MRNALLPGAVAPFPWGGRPLPVERLPPYSRQASASKVPCNNALPGMTRSRQGSSFSAANVGDDASSQPGMMAGS